LAPCQPPIQMKSL